MTSKLAEVKRPIKLTDYLSNKKGWRLELGYNQCPLCYKKKLKIYEDNMHLTCYNPNCKLSESLAKKKLLDIYDILVALEDATNISEAFKLVVNSPLNTFQDVHYSMTTSINYNKVFEVYRREAKSNIRVWEYLKKRNIKGQEIESLIGYARGDVLRNHFSLDYLEERNLITKGVEFFRDRIVFPIKDIRGNIVHLQGRALDPKEELRWLSTKTNSNGNISNEIFNKYEVKDSKSIFLCEGISDTLSLLSLGLPAVGLLGNQITLNSFKDLKNLNEVFVLLDSDKFPVGGINAGEYKSWTRAFPILAEIELERKIQVWAALLPNQVGLKDCNDWIASGVSKEEVLIYWNKANCRLSKFGLEHLSSSKIPDVHRSILKLLNSSEELEEYKDRLNKCGTNLISVIKQCLTTAPQKFT